MLKARRIIKNNHPNLKKDIEDFVHDKALQTSMNITEKTEKNRGRIEKRTAYITSNIDWLNQKDEWKNLCCIGAIHTEFENKKGKSSERFCFVPSRTVTYQNHPVVRI